MFGAGTIGCRPNMLKRHPCGTRDRQIEPQRDRQTDRQTDRQKQRHRERGVTERERMTEIDGQRHREAHRDINRGREGEI